MKYERDRSGKQPSLAHIRFIYTAISIRLLSGS